MCVCAVVTKTMVTCNTGSSATKMNRPRRGGASSSVSSGFRLLDGDQCDTASSVSRNSIYKLKIDAMFDDTRSIASQRVDERASIRTDGKQSVRGRAGGSGSINGGSIRQCEHQPTYGVQEFLEDNVERINNTVQAQIERMFTDVIKDTSACSFPVRCLGSLPLKDKVTSLYGLQEPLRQLYLSGAGHGNQSAGNLEICASGIRVRLASGQFEQMTSFHNIAVWSAVKFVVSPAEGGAAFLPLITDPENIDKSSLFLPLSVADKRRLSSGLHAPIFSVVMRSTDVPRQLECHAFVCQSPEDAIVIAATLYQSLMSHMGSSQNKKVRKPRNENGVSCISIASSSVGGGRRNGHFGSVNQMVALRQLESYKQQSSVSSSVYPPRPPRQKKRSASSSLSGHSDIVPDECIRTYDDAGKKKSHKTKRAPPIPGSTAEVDSQRRSNNKSGSSKSTGQQLDNYQTKDPYGGGDIFTRVAIPRSGSFLNTSGLTRYKSRATRRAAGCKNGGGSAGGGNGGGGGGGSPLGFSELFNEFRLQENLHSLDDILNAIINFDGMSFNDLKPIYKEFLLKLAVTLTKDELYQRSKSIMRRQKKKKFKKKTSPVQTQRNNVILGSRRLSKVFWFGKSQLNKFNKFKLLKKEVNVRSGKSTRAARLATSSSDMSERHNELTLSGQNRNSSSGYVSCSECSYDSEACTCTSANRCYCSLGVNHEHAGSKLPKTNNLDALFAASCGTDDKCYCSLSDGHEEDSGATTTFCDSDSCISTTKCYCKTKRGATDARRAKYTSDNLALDYELFTIGSGKGGGGGGQHVKASEALSAKKSVEMAALFADFKLSQTTDIKNLSGGGGGEKSSSKGSSKRDSGKSKGSPPTKQLMDLRKHHIVHRTNDDYQGMLQRPVSATLEDSLGYLP